MITFTSRSGKCIECLIDGKTVVAFPDESDANATLSLLDEPQDEVQKGVISWPGEYDVDHLSIRGIGHDEGQRVSYVIGNDNIRIAFLATPLHDWSDYEIELLGNVDVLCIPADDAKLVQKLVDEIDPRVLIPLRTSAESAFTDVLKVVGAQEKEPEKEYKLKGALPAENREVVVLQQK